MKDFLGRELKEGDYVFYVTSGRYVQRILGRVIRFTPKMVVIQYIKSDPRRSRAYEETTVDPRNCVIVDYTEE